MKKIISILILLFLSLPTTAIAKEDTTCDPNFIYKTKNTKCIDNVIAKLDNTKADTNKNPDIHANIEGMVGLLAVIFNDMPEELERLLAQESNQYKKSVYVESLYRAGLLERARTYADTNNLSDYFKLYAKYNLPAIKTVKPEFNPSDNDLLIGAYMASGNIKYIESILENYKSADENMVGIAFRMAFMINKFGKDLTPEGRDKSMIVAICKKYECKTNPKDFLRVSTLSSAIWALQSLSKQDEGIKKTLGSFFSNNVKIKQTYINEQTAFSNYMTGLIAFAAIKDNKNINESLAIYEQLGSGEDALKAFGAQK